jgi:hypothetical protein
MLWRVHSTEWWLTNNIIYNYNLLSGKNFSSRDMVQSKRIARVICICCGRNSSDLDTQNGHTARAKRQSVAAAGDYLSGMEYDGATAWDRDKVRSVILQGLGLKLVRVWSTE